MFRFKRLPLAARSLVAAAAIAMAAPVVAQLTPCFERCHAEAMQHAEEGMPAWEVNLLFILCNDLC